MESMVSPGAMTLTQALLAGAIVGIYYDVFRIIRRIFSFGYATIVAQDVFFWLTCAVGVFFVNTWLSGGVVRIYFVLGVMLGWGTYAVTVGALLLFCVDKLVLVARVVYNKLLDRCLGPFFSTVKNSLAAKIADHKTGKCKISFF